MSTRLPLVLASASILAASLALAGCSAGGGSGGSGGGDPQSVQQSALASASAIAGAQGKAQPAADPTKPCTLASIAQAQSAVAAAPPITFQAESDITDGGVECGYTSDDHATILVNVMVFPGTGDFTMQTGVMSAVALTPVSGIGSAAAVGPGELDAVVGGTGLVVLSAGDTDLTQDQLVALAELVAPRIA
jgi:hypothetical protein